MYSDLSHLHSGDTMEQQAGVVLSETCRQKEWSGGGSVVDGLNYALDKILGDVVAQVTPARAGINTEGPILFRTD